MLLRRLIGVYSSRKILEGLVFQVPLTGTSLGMLIVERVPLDCSFSSAGVQFLGNQTSKALLHSQVVRQRMWRLQMGPIRRYALEVSWENWRELIPEGGQSFRGSFDKNPILSRRSKHNGEGMCRARNAFSEV
jgi:hypothetical protein